MKWILPIFYGVNKKLFRTLMTFELFPSNCNFGEKFKCHSCDETISIKHHKILAKSISFERRQISNIMGLNKKPFNLVEGKSQTSQVLKK